MTANNLLPILLLLLLLVGLTPILGKFMAKALEGESNVLSPILRPIESAIYTLAGIRSDSEQHWTGYASSLILFNLVGLLLLFSILRLQDILPFNPQNFSAFSPDLAFNTAVSFVTNTNWQAYSGETTLSYFSQTVGLTVQNFISPAVGLAVALAVIRGLRRKNAGTIGHFFVDLTRVILYILIPLALLMSVFLVWQGVPQNLDPYIQITTLEGVSQTIPQGPVASQVAIKQLGTNGGGFFGANSAHPYENPTPLSNMIELLAILLIPSALVYAFGVLIRDRRQSMMLWLVMVTLFVMGFAIALYAETRTIPSWEALSLSSGGGSMEGKEVRFGVVGSVMWEIATTATSSGSVNAMHDSLTPLAGMVGLVNMMLGEIIFGGVGSGLYGMFMFVLMTVFIAGLLVGRTPEYLGKKIESREILYCMIAFFATSAGILVLSALGSVLPHALSSIQEEGPHGFTEMLYAYTSATANNGSAFGGFNANTPYHNSLLGFAMLMGRYLVIVPLLAIAGSLAAKKTTPATSGTLPTHTLLFALMLIVIILVMGGLTFFPALALGPFAEHLAMIAGKTF